MPDKGMIDIAGAITAVEGPLKFWALCAIAFLIVALTFLRSTRFHAIWASLMGRSLSQERRFRIIRLTVAGLLAISILALILAFAAPLLLQRAQVEQEQVQLNAVLATYSLTLDGSESESVRAEFASAMEAFKQHDYLAARRRMLSLERQVVSQKSREALQGLITATFYGREEHIEGLRFICSQYRGRPLWDARFRYQIHAHVRRIAINEGYESAEKVVAMLRATCQREDMSPIWAGIPLGAIEDLVAGRRFWRGLDHADETFLRYVLMRYPADSVQDHALLVLDLYEQLVERFPQSMLVPMALAGAASQRWESQDHGMAINHAERYLTGAEKGHYPPELTRRVVELLGEAYIEVGRVEDASRLASAYRDAFADRVPNYLSFYAESKLASVSEAAALGPALEEVARAGFPMERVSSMLPHAIQSANEASRNGEFRGAIAEYEEAREALSARHLAAPEAWTKISDELTRLSPLLETATPVELFQEGINSRDRGNLYDYRLEGAMRSIALGLWKHCADTAPNTEEAVKARYLRGATLRRVGDYKGAAKEFEALVARYPETTLTDDALAELARYKIDSWQDVDGAEVYINELLARFPYANAVDNALYTAANFYLRRGQFPKAVSYYARIAADYSERRLAQGVDRVVGALNAVLASAVPRIGIPGLHVNGDSDDIAPTARPAIDHVNSESESARAGFLWGDVIVGVDGTAVETTAQFYRALASKGDGSEVQITVRRGFGEHQVNLNAKTAGENHYAKKLEFFDE